MTPIESMLFIAAAICFVVGLKLLSKASTARRGTLVSAVGMLLAVVGAVLSLGEASALGLIAAGLAIGAGVGVAAARLVKMTAMPEMVALFNGFGGIASLLIGLSTKLDASDANAFESVTVGLAVLIGGVTFTGSLVAWGKLSEKLPGKPWLYPGQNLINAAVVLAAFGAVVYAGVAPEAGWVVWATAGVALVIGVAAVVPIGGADMPVVIALLNSYSGLAACAAGFAIGNLLLIVTGSLVGASGLILTRIMCVAMNRSLANVLFSGFGSGSTGPAHKGEKKEATVMSTEDAYVVLEAASSVVFVPGYGMAVAQAQHAVRELEGLLAANGAEVRFAIHPVAGRMPGHMSVLLAEASVSYDALAELEDVNPSIDAVDVAVVIGANDVVNPAARDDDASPLYGMPIIEVDRARTVLVLKRSLGSGYAGVENPLFFLENTRMVLGDAKKTIESVIAAFKDDG